MSVAKIKFNSAGVYSFFLKNAAGGSQPHAKRADMALLT